MPKYIDADNLKTILEERRDTARRLYGNLGGAVSGCIKILDQQPAADVELVRHGYNVKWEYPSLFECSICGWECCDTVPEDTGIYQYCPNCGAKMDAEPPKEEEDDISRN